MNGMDIFLSICFLLYGCENHNDNKTSVEKERRKNPESSVVNEMHLLDSLTLDSILYTGKFRLKEINSGRFTYTADYNKQTGTFRIVSKSDVAKKKIEYKIYLKPTGQDIDTSELNFFDESKYDYVGSEIEINGQTINLTLLTFSNDSSSKVYPAGLWHWSIDGSAVKYYTYSGREYYLLNGANLYCNGTHCTSYQVYLIVRENKKVTASAFYLKGLFPYSFDEIKLIDIDQNGYPEIYITKNNIKEIQNINDFELYEIDNSGVAKK